MPNTEDRLTATATIKKSATEPPRSPKWEETRKKFVAQHPKCEVCGAESGLNVHHVVPFDFVVNCGRKDLELDPRNLITLCEAGENHHHVVGHLSDWQSYNVRVRTDVTRCVGEPSAKIQTLAWWLDERKNKPQHESDMTAGDRASLEKLLDQMYPGVQVKV